jgi:hypothetical protein
MGNRALVVTETHPEPQPKDDKLSPDDVMYILNAELRPEHQEDPTVIKFINSYLVNRDLDDAARDAGISRGSARVLRSRRDIHNAITKITQTAVLKYGLDANEIVEKVKAVAFFDPIDLVDKSGQFKTNLHDIPANARRAIKKIKIKNLFEPDINGIKQPVGHVAEIEIWDKMKAIEFLGREKGLFKETIKQEHEISRNMKEVLLESRQKAEERRQRLKEAKREVINVSPNSSTLRECGVDPQGDGAKHGGNGQESEGESEAANTVRVSRGQDEVDSSSGSFK